MIWNAALRAGISIRIRVFDPNTEYSALRSRIRILKFWNPNIESDYFFFCRIPNNPGSTAKKPEYSEYWFTVLFHNNFLFFFETMLSGTVHRLRELCRKIKKSPTLRDKLANVQLALGQTILSIVIDNKTRWNSLYECMTRFLISILPSEDLNDFDWDKVASICRTLKPLKECTLALQSNKSDAALAVKVIKFLNHLAHMEKCYVQYFL